MLNYFKEPILPLCILYLPPLISLPFLHFVLILILLPGGIVTYCIHRLECDSVFLLKSHAVFVSMCTCLCAFFCVSIILCSGLIKVALGWAVCFIGGHLQGHEPSWGVTLLFDRLNSCDKNKAKLSAIRSMGEAGTLFVYAYYINIAA